MLIYRFICEEWRLFFIIHGDENKEIIYYSFLTDKMGWNALTPKQVQYITMYVHCTAHRFMKG